MQALVWTGPGLVRAQERPAPGLRDGWALVEPAFVGLCGTDVHIWQGEHPRARAGLIIGHEFVGRVLAGADGPAAGTAMFVNPLLSCGRCVECRRGDRHSCEELRLLGIDIDGGAAEVVAVPQDALVPLPKSVDLRVAALAEPLAVAVRATCRGSVHLGQRVHVIGAGPVGILVGMCARLAGGSPVTICDPATARAEAAAALGLDVVDPTSPDGLAEVVFDCTGHPSVSLTVLQWARRGGTVVAVGAYPGVVGVDLQDLMFRELEIVGTRVYSPGEVAVAIHLLETGRVAVAALVTATVPLSEGDHALERLQSAQELKVLLKVGAD